MHTRLPEDLFPLQSTRKITMKYSASVLAVLAIFLLSGCLPGPNVALELVDPVQGVAGFWHGLWHGFICIVTFIISLFNDNVEMYEVANNGGWYNLGYLLGASCALGGSGAASKRK